MYRKWLTANLSCVPQVKYSGIIPAIFKIFTQPASLAARCVFALSPAVVPAATPARRQTLHVSTKLLPPLIIVNDCFTEQAKARVIKNSAQTVICAD
jgi:hypothetical protein